MSEIGTEVAQPDITSAEQQSKEGFIDRAKSFIRKALSRSKTSDNRFNQAQPVPSDTDRITAITEQLKYPDYKGPGIAKKDYIATGQNPLPTGEKLAAEDSLPLTLPQKGEEGYVPSAQTGEEIPQVPEQPEETIEQVA